MAGPSIIPQKPNVVSPAKMAKNISNSLTLVGVLTSLWLMYLMMSGLMKVSAIIEITTIE